MSLAMSVHLAKRLSHTPEVIDGKCYIGHGIEYNPFTIQSQAFGLWPIAVAAGLPHDATPEQIAIDTGYQP